MINKNYDNPGKLCRKRGEAGISIVEYIVAVTLIGIAFVTWLELTSTGVKNGTFAQRLGDVKSLATSKATELAKDADKLIKDIPKGKRKIGSITPGQAMSGYFELLDSKGELISSAYSKNTQVKFVRQWLIVKDLPYKDEVTVYVAVIYKDTNRVLRLAKAVKADGINIKAG